MALSDDLLRLIKRYEGVLTIGREDPAYGRHLYQFAIAIVDIYGRLGISDAAIASALTAINSVNQLTTKGDILTHDGATTVRKPIGIDDTILTADSTDPQGNIWQDPSYFIGKIGVIADLVTITGTGVTVSPLIAPGYIPVTTQTLDYSLVAADHHSFVWINAATDKIVTLPSNATTAIPVGSWVVIGRKGAGEVSIAAGGGATMYAKVNPARLEDQYAVCVAHKVATDEWNVRWDIVEDIDADVEAYLTVTGIADGTLITAINNLIVGLKAAGLYSRFIALWLICGGTASLHKWNFISPLDLDASFRLTFTGGLTHDASGILPDGTTGYLRTFLKPSVSMTTNDGAIGFYSGTDTAGTGTRRDMGCFVSGSNPCISIGIKRSATSVFDYNNFTSNRINVVTPALTTSAGLFTNSRLSSTIHKVYQNGTEIGSLATANASGSPTTEILICAVNTNATTITPSSYGELKCQGAFVTDQGFTGGEMITLGGLWAAYQSDLGR